MFLLNLLKPIQMMLPKKWKTFSEFFALFLKETSNFEHLKKEMNLIAYAFPKLRTAKDMVS